MSDQTLDMTNTGGAAGNGAGAGGALVKETTTQTFATDVLEPSRQVPVLVDFWALWCGPCRQLGPIIEKAVQDAKGAVMLVKMNIDDHPQIAGQLGIQSIPAVIAFSNGQPVDGFVGALPESQVKAFIERLAGPVPSGAEDLLAEAETLLAAGDIEGAGQLFAAAREVDPEGLPALVGLAKVFLAVGQLDQVREILAAVPEAKAGDTSIAAVKAQLDLAEQTASLGDPSALEAQLAANPADHQARFDLALLLNANGDREGAVDNLLEIMRRDRSWNEEGARKQLLQFFEAWGPTDEATLSGRRRLSSLLFS